MKGKSESTLNPRDNATREKLAAILHRFIEINKTQNERLRREIFGDVYFLRCKSS